MAGIADEVADVVHDCRGFQEPQFLVAPAVALRKRREELPGELGDLLGVGLVGMAGTGELEGAVAPGAPLLLGQQVAAAQAVYNSALAAYNAARQDFGNLTDKQTVQCSQLTTAKINLDRAQTEYDRVANDHQAQNYLNTDWGPYQAIVKALSDAQSAYAVAQASCNLAKGNINSGAVTSARVLQVPSRVVRSTVPVYGCEARCGAMKTVLTTADIAERKRFQFWQDAVCDTFVELDCQAGVQDMFFGEITTEWAPKGNKFYLLAIVLDGELESAPRINGPITGGRGVISGSFDLKQAFNLANVLENPLQAPVKIEEERSVDPSLGRDSIRSGRARQKLEQLIEFTQR